MKQSFERSFTKKQPHRLTYNTHTCPPCPGGKGTNSRQKITSHTPQPLHTYLKFTLRPLQSPQQPPPNIPRLVSCCFCFFFLSLFLFADADFCCGMHTPEMAKHIPDMRVPGRPQNRGPFAFPCALNFVCYQFYVRYYLPLLLSLFHYIAFRHPFRFFPFSMCVCVLF